MVKKKGNKKRPWTKKKKGNNNSKSERPFLSGSKIRNKNEPFVNQNMKRIPT